MTKPPFSCLLTTQVSTLKAFIILNIIILSKNRDDKTDEMEILYRKDDNKGNKSQNEMIGGERESKQYVASCSSAGCTRPISFV